MYNINLCLGPDFSKYIGYNNTNTNGKMLRSDKKKANMQQKHSSKRWVLGTSNRCPDHLSRQFLTTASTFPYSSKNSSAEFIHALSTSLIITNTLTHSHRQTHTHTHTHTHTLTHSHRQTHRHTLLLRQTNTLTHIDKHTHKQTNKQTNKHTHTHSSAEHILALLTWLIITK